MVASLKFSDPLRKLMNESIEAAQALREGGESC
jgi:hypothetical protein